MDTLTFIAELHANTSFTSTNTIYRVEDASMKPVDSHAYLTLKQLQQKYEIINIQPTEPLEEICDKANESQLICLTLTCVLK